MSGRVGAMGAPEARALARPLFTELVFHLFYEDHHPDPRLRGASQGPGHPEGVAEVYLVL